MNIEPLMCPTCAQFNATSKLIPRQINLTEAVYLCEDNQCTYPANHAWIVVPRTIEQMPRETKKRKRHRGSHKRAHSVEFNLDELLETEIDKLQMEPAAGCFDFADDFDEFMGAQPKINVLEDVIVSKAD